MKRLLLLTAVFCAVTAQAQDVIVKKDGSTILTKVLEVNQLDIKYKKFSNQNGPTYTINKSEVMAINYEGGDKDTFEDAARPVVSNASTPFVVTPNLAEDNLKLVREFNSHTPKYLDKDISKKYFAYAMVLGIKEGSIIETPEVKVSFGIKKWYGKLSTFGFSVVKECLVNVGEKFPYNSFNFQYKIIIKLKNKTDKTIFIDLANSYIMQNEQANPYYVPTASTQSHGGTSGGSVNLGAIAGAAGIGGSLGSLASGVNVGGSSTNVNTKTTFSQRIVSVPPLSILELDPMDIGFGRIVLGWGKWDYKNVYHDLYIPYFKDNEQFVGKKSGDDVYYEPKDLKRGEVINIPPIENINPLGAFITYSFDETLDSTQSMRIDFYLKQIMGVNSKIYDGKKVVDYSECPLTIF